MFGAPGEIGQKLWIATKSDSNRTPANDMLANIT